MQACIRSSVGSSRPTQARQAGEEGAANEHLGAAGIYYVAATHGCCEEAAAGAVAMETLLPAALRLYHNDQLDLPTLFRAMSLNPAKRLGLACGRLAEGAPADLVLFDPDSPFVMDRFALKSKSQNTPFDGQRMQGRVLETYVAGEPVYRRD